MRKRAEAQQRAPEAGQKNEALDVDVVCARLFVLLQAPESFREIVCLQEQQAQEMMDLLQKVCLAFMVPRHVYLTYLYDYLLDMPSLDPIYKSPFLNAMLRISNKAGIYPKNLVHNSVTIEGSDPLYPGQFDDV